MLVIECCWFELLPDSAIGRRASVPGPAHSWSLLTNQNCCDVTHASVCRLVGLPCSCSGCRGHIRFFPSLTHTVCSAHTLPGQVAVSCQPILPRIVEGRQVFTQAANVWCHCLACLVLSCSECCSSLWSVHNVVGASPADSFLSRFLYRATATARGRSRCV